MRPNQHAGLLRARPVSPLFGEGAPAAVASSSYLEASACGPPAAAHAIAFTRPEGTTRSVTYPDGLVTDCDAGTRLFSAAGTSAPLTRPVLAMADTASATFVLATDGQLCRFALGPGAALGGCDGIRLDFAATQLRTGRSATLPVVAHSHSRYVLLGAGGQVGLARRVKPPVLGAEQTLLDVLPYTLDDAGVGLLAVTPAGVFSAEVPEGGAPADEAWAVAPVPGVPCPGDPPPPAAIGELRSLRWVNGAHVLAGVARTDAGVENLVVFGGTGSVPTVRCGASIIEGAPLGEPLTCAACPDGALEAFTASPAGDGRFALEARCRESSGRLSVWPSLLDATGCTTAASSLEVVRSAVTATAGASSAASAGYTGELWLKGGAGFSRSARFLDRVPSLVLGGPDDLVVGAPAVVALLPGGPAELEASQLFELRPGQGFVAATTGLDLLAGVAGGGRWAVRDGVDGGTPAPPTVVELEPSGERRLLAAFTTSEAFKPPYHAAALTDARGTVLVVTAFDALLAAELDPSRDVTLASAPVLNVKLVPLNRSEITSLVLLPRALDRYAEGWLLSAGRLHQFRADNPTVWRSTELELPAGEPVALFADAARARVGYRDGRVFALPGRVPVAPRLPDVEGPALDFADVCGQVLALSGKTAFRLATAPGATEGVWQPVALPDGVGKPAKLHPTPDGAFVFFTDGRVVRLEGLVCL
ncbi:MAG: hypothetical protein JNK82_10840 [Myxococcaceae bacterium]|nr:hypothetical protein [Myxococcaceae bacterium]